MRTLFLICFFLGSACILSSCAIKIIKKAPLNAPFLVENTFELKDSNLGVIEKEGVIGRLENQLDDSAQVKIKSPVFFLDILKRPLRFDTGYAGISARNMRASMFALGYYNATATYKADTSGGRKVKVKYTVVAGKPTLIDTVEYNLTDTILQTLARKNPNKRILQEGNPITKAAVLGEINRLVDTFRNNGFYKITAAELRMRGDTTIAALTQISDDPFEQLELLNKAQLAREKPEIKLEMVLVPPTDSSKLQQYIIDSIFVLQDFRRGDTYSSPNLNREFSPPGGLVFLYHKKYIRNGFLNRNIIFKPGQLYRQKDFYTTINNLSRAGIWQSVNVRPQEKDSNKLNMILELIPGKKYGFEAGIEASYSANTVQGNPIGSNLFGVSLNLSLTDRNIDKRAVKMTHALRAGVEVNSGNGNSSTSQLLNSSELTYTNNVLFPTRRYIGMNGEAFINTKLSLINRFKLFDLQSFSTNVGAVFSLKENQKLTLRPINLELNYLNKSDSFKTIISANPFLRYSYTTSYILGMSASYSSIHYNPKHPLSLSKERIFRSNIEESGLIWGSIPIFKKFKSRYVKADVEYIFTTTYKNNNALVLRAFAGVGIPLVGDSSLPFFKQYFAGGSNSMRGWPIRGIGRGSQKLAPYGTIFNDRTGDVQLEANAEYRYSIARIIPNTLTLRGALFVDVGNIWNVRSLDPPTTDSAQFNFKNLYKELGMAVGTGFRLDFNYVIVRVDLGFRVKRPELSDINDGWKLPNLSFNDAFGKLFTRGVNNENRRWRYENFNLTFGINYPF